MTYSTLLHRINLLIVLCFLSLNLCSQEELTISYIHRTPEIDWVINSNNPTTDGWPADGQAISWEGVVKNWGSTSHSGIEYKWYLDGVEIETGTFDIEANSEKTISYPTTWSFERKELRLEIDCLNQVVEEFETNNSRVVFTDAISVGFYVEQSLYDYFRQNQRALGIASACWEDWAYRHVKFWNELFENATYPSAPQGVQDRIRLDKITVVPDGALPLAGGLPSNNPNVNDRTVDLIWGFPSQLITNGFYDNITSTDENNPFFYEPSLLHELGHARYLVDLYGFNIDGGTPGERIQITEEGEFILGTDLMPFIVWDIPFQCPHQGFMNSHTNSSISEFTVLCMNRIAAHRATAGNMNAPGNIGEFLDEIPLENELTLKDDQGNVVPNASVEIYQASTLADVWYGATYDDTPDLSLTTDADGKVLLGSNPFSSEGTISHGFGFANGVIILRVENESGLGYGFLDLPTFNVEYMRGNTEFASYELLFDNWKASPISSIDFIAEQGLQSIMAFPNPASETLTLRINAAQEKQLGIQILDVNGIRHRQEAVYLSSGNTEIQISLSALPSGLYTIYIPEMNTLKRFMKL